MEYKKHLINKQSSAKEIKEFCDEFLKVLRQKLIESGYKEVESLELFEIEVQFNGCGNQVYYKKIIFMLGCCYNENNTYYTMKSLKKDLVIGQVNNLTFQEEIITQLAEALAWKANLYINREFHNKKVRPHGKEFKQICKILRGYTNSLLSDKAVFGIEV